MILLEDASFAIHPGEKIGLVGVNGAGKTTLLKVLYGELDADAGKVVRPEHIGYLAQERLADAQQVAVAADGTSGGAVTIRDFMFAARNLGGIIAELRRIETALDQATTVAQIYY